MSQMTAPNLGLHYGWTLGEDNWNPGMDQNLILLDAVVNAGVLRSDLVAPPAAPAAGDRYLVPAAGATGAWAGHANALAVFFNGAWEFFAPYPGLTVYDRAAKAPLFWDETAPGVWRVLTTVGSAGRGITDATVNGAGHLIVTYSDATTQDAGYVVGAPGAATNGTNGRGITGATINSAGHLIIAYSDATTQDAGVVSGGGGGGGGTPAAANGVRARGWRLLFHTSNDVNYLSFLELQFRQVAGVAEQATGGVASSPRSYFGASSVSSAFDSDPSTRWASGAPYALNNLTYIFAADKDVVEVAILPNANLAELPTGFDIQYSLDGGSTWVTAKSVVGYNSYVSGVYSVFSVTPTDTSKAPGRAASGAPTDLRPFGYIHEDTDTGHVYASAPTGGGTVAGWQRLARLAEIPAGGGGGSPVTAHSYWRALCMGVNDIAMAATRIEMYDVYDGATNLCVGGSPVSDGSYGNNPDFAAAKAFDGNDATFYIGPDQKPRGAWVGYNFPAPVIVKEILWKARTDGYPSTTPYMVFMQFSDDGVHWRTSWVWGCAPDWVTAETRRFQSPFA